jgi:uncharacterized protein with HEPN domain
MSEKDWDFRLADILYSIERIEAIAARHNSESFAEDQDARDIVDRRFQIIGDATRKIPDEFKNIHPDIPWLRMAGLRNFVVHEYNNVDPAIIWDTIQKNLPELKEKLAALAAKTKR